MSAVERARHWLSQNPLVLDTETTGLGSYDEIVQIAFVTADGEPLLDTLVRPTRPIPQDVVRIHGITDADVRDAPTGAEVCFALRRLLEGRLVCTYNAPFDCRLLAQTAAAWQTPLVPIRSECVMRLYAEFAGVWDVAHGNNRWFSLGTAARRCGLGPFHEHNALADARITAQILKYVANAALPAQPPAVARATPPWRA